MKNFATLALLAISASSVFAADCFTEIAATDQMQFDKKSISVPKSCKSFKLTLKHTGKLPKASMGHNWVLSESSALQAVANDGMAAGAINNYVKPGDARVIAATKLLAGGETDSVDVDVSKLKAGTDYSYYCTFPGHPALMRGTLTLAN